MTLEVRPGLAPGTWIGVFQIEAAIGAGGMGEVYRARDTKLGRHVAIKVLPDRLSADPDRRTRFAREARALAALNHPHIAAIYGFEESGGSAALVLELVDGPTLAERLRNGPLPLDEALSVAVQIAEAIEAAHDRGIVHRDLKPANIKITAGGVVKVLDFGLAKAAAGDSADGATGSAALTVAGTEAGVILGTAAYMSPEQARAQAVDKRTDVWAFGCVLFEMLAGQRAFRGDTLPEILARVIEREPDWSLLPARTPSRIHDLLRRCLEKDPKKRRRDIADVRLDLEQVLAAPAESLVPELEAGRRPRRAAPVVWTGVALLAALATGAAVAWRVMPPAGGQRLVLEIPSPPTRDPASLALSRDGRQVVFAATADHGTKLLLRTLETGAVRWLKGTDGGQFPFWSPDGRAIGFFAEGSLKRIDLASETVLRLAPASNPGGGAWNTDGTILFVPVGGSRVMQIPEDGVGEATAATPAMGATFANPRLLPDGRHFLFNNTRPAAGGLYVGSLDQHQDPRRIGNMSLGEYASSGYLFFMRSRTLYAQRFDPETAKLSGTAIQIADNVTALSAGGDSIAYRTATSSPLVWFNRSGDQVDTLPGEGNMPSISRDGRVVVTREGDGTNIGRPELWMWSGSNGFHKFGVTESAYNTAIWSYDDAKIYFSSPRGHPFALYEKASDGSGGEPVVKQTEQSIFANDRSPDGRFIIYRSSDPKGFDLWKLTLADKREEPLVNTSANEREAQFSPDGRWFAYQSDEGGQYEIYIKPFPDAGRTRIGPVSVGGGTQVRWNPRWNPAGGELFYLGSDGRLMSVIITTSDNGQKIEHRKPTALFQTNIHPAGVFGQQYAVDRDRDGKGLRFLIYTTPEAVAPITILLNWKPGS